MVAILFRSVGDVISRIRQDRNIDDVSLTHEAGINVDRLLDIEQGVPPSDEELAELADVLDIRPVALRLVAGDLPDQLQHEITADPETAVQALESAYGISADTEREEPSSQSPPDPRYTTSQETLYKGDCCEALPTLEPESFDLIFCAPPFNLGKDYGEATEFHDAAMTGCADVLLALTALIAILNHSFLQLINQ